ncbi:hypothetical protein N7536_006020 [Penicillium majusculum]|uniref:CWC16 protein n=1 Tax=Penicillium solitum TaxID=60172 RepID=A0A1V6RPU2_9EURO|nr:uncharacterized protein PENSOL_c001G08629 [Penicillium solitum]KAJ5695608.1 hypothetical protein N7536_006020 [Penicillium majusculum]OQE03802.1 hypothetical protein PENSOL_c001G08629 [Penicillium solitum]
MQGFNMGRYVPPDQEGVTTGNQIAGKHPLGARARHLHTTGALIVRFEMPFAIWCTNCKPHPVIIGQGVRFNAEKKKIGNYYTTPIYSFRMKHTVCGGTIEIKTDPQHTAYVVTEGGRKRDTGEDKELQPGEIAIKPFARDIDPAEKDPFSKIEGKMEDKNRAKTEAARILELQERQKRDWEDPYAKSKQLRKKFRQERKGLENAQAKGDALKDKMSLGIELLDETEEDRQKASMVEFGGGAASAAEQVSRMSRLRPMFEQPEEKPTRTTPPWLRTRKGDLIASRKAAWRRELIGNTRARIDPFLQGATHPSTWKHQVKKKKTVASSKTATSSTPSLRDDPSGTELDSSTDAPKRSLVIYSDSD